jgi:hypothetical protein
MENGLEWGGKGRSFVGIVERLFCFVKEETRSFVAENH